MFKIKYLLFFFFIIESYAQNYSLINKAENLLNQENQNFKKIERLLAKAERRDYGFCANAKVEALSRINYLKAKVLFLKKDYSKSLVLLSSDEVWAEQKSADSLKVESLIQIYGKSNVQKSIFKESDKIIVREENYLYNKICLNLNSLNYIFCFNDQDESLDYKKEISILEIIKKCNFYHLLIE